jgi:hypothetical protein
MKCLAGLLICIAGCFPTLADPVGPPSPPVYTVTSFYADATGVVTMSGPGFSLSASAPTNGVNFALPGDPGPYSASLPVLMPSGNAVQRAVVGGITYGSAAGEPVTELCGNIFFNTGVFTLPDNSAPGPLTLFVIVGAGLSDPNETDRLVPGVPGGCSVGSPAFVLDVSGLAPSADLFFDSDGSGSAWLLVSYTFSQGTFTPVPEPATLPLLAALLFAAGMGRALRRKMLQPGHRFLFR